MSESKAMKEIHKIRVKNYEETKNMNDEEYIKHIKAKASKSNLKFSLLTKRQYNVNVVK